LDRRTHCQGRRRRQCRSSEQNIPTTDVGGALLVDFFGHNSLPAKTGAATPPPTACPSSAPTSTPPAEPASIGMSDCRTVPPATPPIAPEIELPSVPRS